VADTGETCIMERKYDGGDIPRPTWFRVVVVRTGQDIAILSQDITERKKVEEAVLVSEERFHRLFAAMDEGFILCEVLTDEGGRPGDFRYLDLNPAGERFFGRPREEIVGRTYREIGGTKADEEWIAMLGNVALTGQPATLERYAPVGGHWVGLRAYSPRPGQFAAVFADITERKRAEEALEESEAKTREIVESIQDPFYAVDRDWRIVYVNPDAQAAFHKTSDEIIGHALWDGFPIPRDSKAYRELTRAMQ